MSPSTPSTTSLDRISTIKVAAFLLKVLFQASIAYNAKPVRDRESENPRVRPRTSDLGPPRRDGRRNQGRTKREMKDGMGGLGVPREWRRGVGEWGVGSRGRREERGEGGCC
jgi:hypothetical protein